MPLNKVYKRSIPRNENFIFSVNFREPEKILQTIEHLLGGECALIKKKLINLAISILGRFDPFMFELEDRLEILRIAQTVSQFPFENIPSVNHQIAIFGRTMLSHCKPTTAELNANIVSAFTKFFVELDSSEQTNLYKTVIADKVIHPTKQI